MDKRRWGGAIARKIKLSCAANATGMLRAANARIESAHDHEHESKTT